MLSRIRSWLTYPHVVSTVALFAALGGAAYAGTKIDTKDLQDKAVTNAKIAKKTIKGNRIATNTITGAKINESTLGQVPSALNATSATNAQEAANAQTLQGIGPAGFVPASSEQRFFLNLSFGQSATAVEFAGLTLTAQCLQNTTDNGATANRDVARLVISTAENGATFDTPEDSKNGSAAGNFLDTTTPEADRVFAESSVATGASDLSRAAEEGFAMNAAGNRSIVIPENGIGFAHSLYGQNCIIVGTARTLGG